MLPSLPFLCAVYPLFWYRCTYSFLMMIDELINNCSATKKKTKKIKNLNLFVYCIFFSISHLWAPMIKFSRQNLNGYGNPPELFLSCPNFSMVHVI